MRYSALTLALLAACSSTPPTSPGQHGVAARLVRVSGDSQTGVAGYLLDNPVVLRVIDSSGDPITGATVMFAVDPADPNGALPVGLNGGLASSSVSDSSGLVTTTWRLGGSLGAEHAIAATLVNGVATSTVTHLTATARSNAVLAIDGGSGGLCAIDLSGHLGCWQPPNLNRGAAATTLPVRMRLINPSMTFTSMAMGAKGAGTPLSGCALATGGTVWCFNANNISAVTELAQLPGSYPTFTHLVGGGGPYCALTSDGSAWCWGSNFGGVLGDGTENNRTVPAAVPTAARFVSLEVTQDEACGLTADGQAWCWGDNLYDQAGAPNPNPGHVTPIGPTHVNTSIRFSQLALYAYGNMACGVASDGVYCWGDVSAFASTPATVVPDTTSVPRLMATGAYRGVAWGGGAPFFFLPLNGPLQYGITGELCSHCSIEPWIFAPPLTSILQTQGSGMICGGTLPMVNSPILCMDTDTFSDFEFAGFPPTFGVPFP